MIWPKEVTLVSRTQPSGPLCLWQCFLYCWQIRNNSVIIFLCQGFAFGMCHILLSSKCCLPHLGAHPVPRSRTAGKHICFKYFSYSGSSIHTLVDESFIHGLSFRATDAGMREVANKKRLLYSKVWPPPLKASFSWFFWCVQKIRCFLVQKHRFKPWVKLFAFACGQRWGGWLPSLPYSQPDRKYCFLPVPF